MHNQKEDVDVAKMYGEDSKISKNEFMKKYHLSEEGLSEEKANENLISTMNEAVKIQQDGRKKRQEAEAELEKLEQDIRRSLLAGA